MQVSIPPELAQGARWYVVHTRPNSERKAELNLEAQEFKTFLPQIERTARHARRLTTVRRPLFPRYLFVRLDVGRDRWLSVNSHSDAGLTRLDRALAEGQRVRILSGPLANFTATVVRLDARRRVDVLLEIMGAAVSVSVDRRALAPAA